MSRALASLALCAQWMKNAVVYGDQNKVVLGISTDSRTVDAHELFFALKGERFDAHNFLHEVNAKNVAAVVVEHLPENYSGNAIVVPNVKLALAEFSAAWRTQFTLPIVAVTGSNGKTTTKEMIATILAVSVGEERRLATKGNLNNEIGVPLTLAKLRAEHRVAVLELGMNHPGEIEFLANLVRPLVGLVNNAQREHQEFMETVEAVAHENGSVLSSLPHFGVAVYPGDDTYTPIWQNLSKHCHSLTFGLNESCAIWAEVEPQVTGQRLTIHTPVGDCTVELKIFGIHNARNAIAAAACSLAAGASLNSVAKGLSAFEPVKGRLQAHQHSTRGIVIDDTYNANPDSVRAAIDVLAQQNGIKVLILGDMGEVGNQGNAFHKEIGLYAKEVGIDYLLTLGNISQTSTEAFGEQAKHYTSAETLYHDAAQLSGKAWLIKGSRFMKMEQILDKLLMSEIIATSINQPTNELTDKQIEQSGDNHHAI